MSKLSNLKIEDRDAVRDCQAIIFDCDGTLVDSMPVHFLAWHETMSRYGIVFPEEQFYAWGGIPTHRIIEMLSKEQGVFVDASKVAMEKEQGFLKRLDLLEPIEPVVEIAKLYVGCKPMSVASGGFRDIVLQQLLQVKLHNLFEIIVAAEDTERHKPDPDVFLEAARRMQIDARHCLVFEDADLGIEAARRAGMPCIDVRSFFTPRRMALGT